MSGEKYVNHVFLAQIYSPPFDRNAGKWMPVEKMRSLMSQALRKAIEQHGYEIGERYSEIPLGHLNEMLSRGVLLKEGDDFTGVFVRFEQAAKDRYIKSITSESEVSKRLELLGSEALSRAISVLAAQEGWPRIGDDQTGDGETQSIELEVPAADRVVRLDDNSAERDVIVQRVDELADAIRGHNDEDGKLGDTRERLGAELRSGQELLKSPSVRVKALLAVLGTALTFIAVEFAGGVIGQLAADLLERLKPLLGL